MYPLDRRKLALHVYSLLASLRKTSTILQVSHTTISRWLKHPERKVYTSRKEPMSRTIVDTIKAAIHNDPFVSIHKLRDIIQSTFSFSVSRELVRTAIKRSGYSRKHARFFSEPSNLASKTAAFLQTREAFKQQGRPFVSLDETSFGRNGVVATGYAPKGKRLRVKKLATYSMTTSVMAVVSKDDIVATKQIKGSFNTLLFTEFIKTLDLQRGTVIMLDNVAFHHSKACKEVADAKGYDLLFVPPYSPWFNPIEGIFSIVKRSFYKGATIQQSFDAVTRDHLSAFFRKSLEATERW